MIRLSSDEWKKILIQLKEEYSCKPSVFMIREVMKRELGFTTRSHDDWNSRIGYTHIIYLDFYDDVKETYFRLKYL